MPFTEQPREKTWNATTGWQNVRVWEGPSEELDDFWENVAPPGYIGARITERSRGVVSASDSTELLWLRIELTYGIAASTAPGSDPGLISRTWTVDAVEEQVSILSHNATIPLWQRSPTWVQQLKACAENYATRVEEALRANPSSTLSGILPVLPLPPTGATSGEILKAGQLFDILVRDINFVGFTTKYTLRKSEVVNRNTLLTLVHTNVDRVFTNLALSNAEPTLELETLVNATALTSLKWLKKTPKIEQLGGGLSQLVQEYESGVYFEPYTHGDVIVT